jgi:XTP/dITP diphosphohydrolase
MPLSYNGLGMNSIPKLRFVESELSSPRSMSIQVGAMELVLATRNRHKAREIRAMLRGTAEVLTLDDVGFRGDIVENGRTFEANARIKVRCLTTFLRSKPAFRNQPSLLALADDSGLEVDVLRGAPGVFSARYAGEPSNAPANTAKLLKKLQSIPPARRGAQFRCVLAVQPVTSGSIRVFEGICRGRIGFEPRGRRGFGYDPVFFPSGSRRTFAEISAIEKNRRSHRARAMKRFRRWISRWRERSLGL